MILVFVVTAEGGEGINVVEVIGVVSGVVERIDLSLSSLGREEEVFVLVLLAASFSVTAAMVSLSFFPLSNNPDGAADETYKVRPLISNIIYMKLNNNQSYHCIFIV